MSQEGWIDAFHVVCPHCGQTNKLPSGKPPLSAQCGTCHNLLFDGQKRPPGFRGCLSTGVDRAAPWRRCTNKRRKSWNRPTMNREPPASLGSRQFLRFCFCISRSLRAHPGPWTHDELSLGYNPICRPPDRDGGYDALGTMRFLVYSNKRRTHIRVSHKVVEWRSYLYGLPAGRCKYDSEGRPPLADVKRKAPPEIPAAPSIILAVSPVAQLIVGAQSSLQILRTESAHRSWWRGCCGQYRRWRCRQTPPSTLCRYTSPTSAGTASQEQLRRRPCSLGTASC